MAQALEGIGHSTIQQNDGNGGLKRMAIIKATYECDKCGKILDKKDLNINPEIVDATKYDYGDRCLRCRIEDELWCARQAYYGKKAWLEQTFLKDLQVLKDRMGFMQKVADEHKIVLEETEDDFL